MTCGQYFQPCSVGGGSDAAICCELGSSLSMLVSGHNLRFFLQCQFCSEDFISLLQASNYAERLFIYLFRESVAFSVLTLLVGRQEEHLACKN